MNPQSTVDGLWQQAQRQFSGRDFDAARVACEALLSIRATHSGAHLMLADLCGRRDQHRQAVWHAIAAANSMGRESLQHIGAVSWRLMSLGEYGRAISLIRKINLSQVSVASFLADVSQQLSILEQHHDALRWLDAAVDRGLDAESTAYLRGNYLRFLGRLEEAAQEYERSIAFNPRFAYAHWALAYLDVAAGREQRIDRIRGVLGSSGIPDRDRAYLGYALFKELDAIDDTEAAWHALMEGAGAKRRTLDHDTSAESLLFDELIAKCGPGFVDPSTVARTEKVPIFVLGMPRTGTTVVERILGGHPRVTLCGELNDFRKQYRWAVDHACTGAIDRIGVARLPSVDFDELGRRYLDHVAWRTTSTTYFTDKRPENWVVAGLILKALPQARIIHLRRNPMDTCFSNLKELFATNFYPYSYSLDELAGHYRSYRRLMAHWHAIAPGRILDVQYEDLVSDPEGGARRIMAYCGLDFSSAQLRIETRAMPVSTASSAQVRQAIHGRNVGGWQRYARQLEPLRQRLQDDGWL